MKNVKIILLLSVILCFFYFIKINEGFGPFDTLTDYFTSETDDTTAATTTTDTTTTDTTTADTTTADTTTQIICPTSTPTSTTASSDIRRNNTSLMNICSTDDAVRNLNVRNLNDNIPDLPEATLIYPKDPVSIKYLKLLPEDLTTGNTTITDGQNQNEVDFTSILKDSQNKLQTWWEYDFKDSTETPEINIKDSDDNEINTNIDLVYLSGCSQIITPDESSANNDNTPLHCHHNKDMNTCNLQEHCVWDALCEQPHRNEEHSNKIFTPKECILNGGIFRSDLLYYAKNTIVNDEISTSFNMKDITDIWFKTSNSIDAGQNDSDSCNFNPTNLQDSYLSKLTQSPEITDSYLDSSCYPPLMKRMFGDTPDIDNILGVDADDENITTKNSGAIFKSDNSYNNPMNLFDFRIDDPNCTWSQRMDTPEQFAQCFNKDINYNLLPSITDWSGMTCDKWSTDNPTDNCSTNTGNTRLNSEKIIENSNLSNDNLKEYCCLPSYTCTNIHGVYPNDQDVTQFSCPQDSRFNANVETCSEEGCTSSECCSPAFTCDNIHGVDSDQNFFLCQGDTFLKENPDNCSNDGCSQSNCCEEPPSCNTHYSSDEDCPGGYYFDTNARCTTQDCSVSDCCKAKATCYHFQCNTDYRLKNNGRTSCPTDEGSCSNSICCEPVPTCSDMSESITCLQGKKLDGNRIWRDYDTGLCCIDEALPLTPPRSNCGAEAESFQCPDGSILDTYKTCQGDNCVADNCCKDDTYFCKARDSDVIYQNADVPPPPDTISHDPSCSSGGLTNFIWESCSNALSSIDLSSYPYIGNIYQACGVEPPSALSGQGDANIPTTLNTQPSCSADICTTGKVLRSNIPPICSSETCTVDECCEDENTCANYYHSNTCPAGNKTDGVCNDVCTPEDCCLPSNTINLSLQISDISDTLNTILGSMIIVPDSDPSKVYFTSDDTWNQYNTSSFLNMKYTPTDNISPASSITDPNTDPNTDPDYNSIKYYVKGSNDVPDISNLVTQEAITGNGIRDILTFIVELNNLHFKSDYTNNDYDVNLEINCGDSNFQSSDIYLYKFLLYKENNNLKLYTSSPQLQDKDTFINSSLPSPSDTYTEYDIGTINGSEITFDINSILTQISSHLNSHTPNTFEEILLKLLMLKTDDIYTILGFSHDNSSSITDGVTIVRNGIDLLEKLCKLELDISGDKWTLNSRAVNIALSGIQNNFVNVDSGGWSYGGPTIKTHFSVCPNSFTISDIPSLIIRLKELILTGIDIYTLYNSEYTDDNFNKDPIGCGSSTLVDGSVFTPDEITTINSFITDYGIDISNLQYTSPDTSSGTPSPENIHYTDGEKNIDTIVLTIS